MFVPSPDGINPMLYDADILLLEMKIMETSIKNLAAPKGRIGLLKSLAALRSTKIKMPSPEALPFEMFTYGVPYEATETYRNIRKQFEKDRSIAIIEARQALFRC